MNVKHLQYFITIAEEGNISKAAEKLFVSQSSLSYYITALEKEIGTPLFLRRRNGVELTEAGRKYEKAARKVISIRDQLYSEIASDNKTRQIVVSTTSLWGLNAFSRIVPEFKKEHPEANFQLSQTDILYLAGEIENGHVDFALIAASPFSALERSMRILRNEPFYLAMQHDHPYTQKNTGDTVTLDDYRRYFSEDTLILSHPKSANYITVMHALNEAGIEVRSLMDVNGLSLTCQMVANGNGVTFMPESGIARENEVRYYLVEPEIYRYNILVSKPKDQFTAMEKAFYRFVQDYFRR